MVHTDADGTQAFHAVGTGLRLLGDSWLAWKGQAMEEWMKAENGHGAMERPPFLFCSMVRSENERQLIPRSPQSSPNLTVFCPVFRRKPCTVYKLLPLMRGRLTAGEQRDSIQKIESLR